MHHLTAINLPSATAQAVLFTARSVIWAAALASIGASAWLGFAYGYQFGLAFGVIAVCAEIFKPVAMQMGFAHLGNWKTLHRAPFFIGIAVVCVVYSLLAELALSATGRGDLVAERVAQSDRANDARSDRKRFLDELSTLKPSRPVAEMEAVIKGARSHCEVRIDLKRRETVCWKDPKLLAELGRAQRRAEIEQKVASLGNASAVAVRVADPLATALSALYLDVAHIRIEPDAISKWLYLVPVILIEVCSAFGLIVAGSATRSATLATVAPALPATTVATGRLPTIQPRQLLLATRQPTMTDRELVLAVLRNSRRPLSNNELAAAMGCHKSEASRRVAGLNGVVQKVRAGRYVAISLYS